LITTIIHTGPLKSGRACFHRARFLEELIKLIPPSTVIFKKTLSSISSSEPNGPLSLNFSDGSTATASCIVACDGIKSIARTSYVLSDLSDQQILRPVFANDFAYRGMYTRSRFLEITGNAINPGKGTIFCGPESYVVMYPVEKGRLINVVAVKHATDCMIENEKNWVQAVSKETMLSDFAAWGEPIKALLEHIQKPERWALYDHLPAPTYVKGRVAIMGDSAHASTPHQGQGAGMAFEDSFVLSGILGAVFNQCLGEQATEQDLNRRLEACLQAYDEVRRPRTQDITRTSREMGLVIECVEESIGKDAAKMKSNLDKRMHWIWDINLPEEVDRGIQIAKVVLRTGS
jgi:salicylate hydroxylase